MYCRRRSRSEPQNVIERSLIIVDSNEFSVDKNWFSHEFQSSPRVGPAGGISTEREQIEAALARSTPTDAFVRPQVGYQIGHPSAHGGFGLEIIADKLSKASWSLGWVSAIEQHYRDQPDNWKTAIILSQAYAAAGQKDSAIKTAERAIMLLPSSKDPLKGPTLEENFARIQAMFGEHSRAISTLRQLLQTPYVRLFFTPQHPLLPRF